MTQEPEQQPLDQRRTFITIGILFAIGVIIWLFQRASTIGWIGFGTKTLWDWLDLLILPIVFGVVAYLFRQAEKRSDQRISTDNQRETALQTYIDRMSELMLNKELRISAEMNAEVLNIARTRTFTILRRLDAERQGIVIQFLQGSQLINKGNPIITLAEVRLSGADLRGINLRSTDLRAVNLNTANLSGANLRETELSQADLSFADLRAANLREANLSASNLRGATLAGADLTSANLSYVNFTQADLTGANLTDAAVTPGQLATCKTLRGAILPDGTKAPDNQDFPAGWK